MFLFYVIKKPLCLLKYHHETGRVDQYMSSAFPITIGRNFRTSDFKEAKPRATAAINIQMKSGISAGVQHLAR